MLVCTRLLFSKSKKLHLFFLLIISFVLTVFGILFLYIFVYVGFEQAKHDPVTFPQFLQLKTKFIVISAVGTLITITLAGHFRKLRRNARNQNVF